MLATLFFYHWKSQRLRKDFFILIKSPIIFGNKQRLNWSKHNDTAINRFLWEWIYSCSTDPSNQRTKQKRNTSFLFQMAKSKIFLWCHNIIRDRKLISAKLSISILTLQKTFLFSYTLFWKSLYAVTKLENSYTLKHISASNLSMICIKLQPFVSVLKWKRFWQL